MARWNHRYFESSSSYMADYWVRLSVEETSRGPGAYPATVFLFDRTAFTGDDFDDVVIVEIPTDVEVSEVGGARGVHGTPP